MCRILLLCLLVVANMAHAQTALDTASFLHFNLKNELPTNNVYSAIQDHNGYIWLATDNGLVKYNGYKFYIYNTAEGGLPANDIFELYEDRRGRIWLNSFSYEFGYFKNGRYKAIHHKAGDRMFTPFHLSEAGDLFYFVEYRRNILNILFVADDVIKAIPLHSHSFPGSNLWNIVLTSNMQFSLFTKDMHLWTFDHAAMRYKDRGLYPEPFRYNFAHRSSVSPNNELFMSTVNGDEVHYFDLNNKIYKKLSISENGGKPTEKLYTVNAHYYKGNYAGYTTIFTNSHAYNFTKDNVFINRQRFTDIIPSKAQLAFRTKDRSGNYWYSTKEDGLWFKPSFYNFYAGCRKKPMLRNAAYLGAVRGINYWWDNEQLSLYEYKNDQLTKTWKFAHATEMLCIAGNDSISYISATDGVYRLDPATKSLTNIKKGATIRNLNHSVGTGVPNSDLTLSSTRNMTLWENTLYAHAHDGMRSFTLGKDTIVVRIINADRYKGAFFDEQAALLYNYSNRRIFIQDLKNARDTLLGDEFLTKAGIKNISHLEKDKYGNIFIVDDSHLFIFDPVTYRSHSITSKFSLAGATFRVVGTDLFIAGRFGIAYAKIMGKNLISEFFCVPNTGMGRYNQVKQFAVDDSGNATLQTESEAIGFHVDSFKKYATSINRPGQYFSLIAQTPVEEQLRNNDTLRIVQSESVLKLDAINWYAKGDPEYTYRIDGSNKWQHSTSGEIFLATLAAGKYHKIECQVSDDAWISGTYTFYVYRFPYWWQTPTWRTIFWVAGIAVLFIIILLIILITRNYVARKSEKKRALTELELRAIHSQINPHFIFNTLSASLYFISKKRFDDAYEHVNKFSRLLRSYLKSSQDRFVILEEEISMLRNYIELQQIRFEEKFLYSIEVDNKLPLNNIRIPSLLLQPLVENAINHGLFHKGGNGRLDLKFLQGVDSSELICIIEDNGVGREAARRINEVSSAKESYGTKLTNQLLDIFKEYEHLDISLEYTDKEAPETGTMVTLTLRNIKYVA